MDKFYYMRGVAPKEAREAVAGKNGRVLDGEELTNRGNDPARLAFGMNEVGVSGVDSGLVSEFILDASYYANIGAYAEARLNLPNELRKNLSPENRGYLLVFARDESLPIHKENLNYGHSWRTTSELPVGIEKSLVGIVPAAPMGSASSLEDYKEGDYSLFGRQIGIESFDKLKARIESR